MDKSPEPEKTVKITIESGPKDTVRYPFKEFLILLIIFFCYILISIPGFYTSPIRASIAKTGSELRSIGDDLELYFKDNKMLPPGYAYAGDITEISKSVSNFVLSFSYEPKEPDFNYLLNIGKVKRYRAIAFIVSAVLWLIIFNIAAGAENTIKLFSLFLFLLIIYLLAIKVFFETHFIFMTAGFMSLHGFLWLVIRFIQVRFNRIRIPREEYMIAAYLPLVVITTLLVFLIGFAAIGKKTPVDQRKSYQYATDGKSTWILQSTGPDADYDLDLNALFSRGNNNNLSSMDEREFENIIQEHSYDPTNGIYSSGDIIRSGY